MLGGKITPWGVVREPSYNSWQSCFTSQHLRLLHCSTDLWKPVPALHRKLLKLRKLYPTHVGHLKTLLLRSAHAHRRPTGIQLNPSLPEDMGNSRSVVSPSRTHTTGRVIHKSACLLTVNMGSVKDLHTLIGLHHVTFTIRKELHVKILLSYKHCP